MIAYEYCFWNGLIQATKEYVRYFLDLKSMDDWVKFPQLALLAYSKTLTTNSSNLLAWFPWRVISRVVANRINSFDATKNVGDSSKLSLYIRCAYFDFHAIESIFQSTAF